MFIFLCLNSLFIGLLVVGYLFHKVQIGSNELTLNASDIMSPNKFIRRFQ